MVKEKTQKGCFFVNTSSVLTAVALTVVWKKLIFPQGVNSIGDLLAVILLTTPFFALVYFISFRVLVKLTGLCRCNKEN